MFDMDLPWWEFSQFTPFDLLDIMLLSARNRIGEAGIEQGLREAGCARHDMQCAFSKRTAASPS